MKKIKKYISFFILGIASIGLIYAGYNMLKWYQDYKRTKTFTKTLRTVLKKEINTDDLNNKYLYNPPSNKNDSYYNFIATPFLNVDLSSIIKENNDTVAWLEVGQTNINYPILQTTNNSFYLNHSFDKKNNNAGWIFLDYRNNLNKLSKNTIIYGHRRLDNTMFGPLIKFLNKEWILDQNNQIIRMSTNTENTIWQIISVYSITKENYYLKTTFPNNTYETFLNTIKNRSLYDFNASLNINDYILTLSTCLNNNGARIVVHARLIKKETKIN